MTGAVAVVDVPIAQLNIARARWPLDDERMAAFAAQIDEVNALADEAPGFVWRLQGEDGAGSSYVQAFDDPHMLVNLSVWDSAEALRAFVFSPGHMAMMRRRADWFEPGTTESIAWDIQDREEPTIEQALARLEAFRRGEGGARDVRLARRPSG